MDFSFSISERLALELLNKKFNKMLKSVSFRDGIIGIEIYIMLSAIKIELRILELDPKEGITIEFVGNGMKSFMVKKVISGFYEKLHLEKTDKDNIYKYSWKNSLDLLKDYKELLTSSSRTEIHCEDGIFKLDFFLF
jgi:hypothetical protein